MRAVVFLEWLDGFLSEELRRAPIEELGRGRVLAGAAIIRVLVNTRPRASTHPGSSERLRTAGLPRFSLGRRPDAGGPAATHVTDSSSSVLARASVLGASGAFGGSVLAYRRERSHVEGEGWSGGAEKGRCRGQQGRAPRRYTGGSNPLGYTPALAALD